MSESFWNDLIDYVAEKYRTALDYNAYPGDPVAIEEVYKRVIYDPSDWHTDDAGFWRLPMIQIYGIEVTPTQDEQMTMGGTVQPDTRSVTNRYTIYTIGAIEGDADEISERGRILATRMMTVARTLPKATGEVAPASNGEKLTDVTFGPQNLDWWQKATTDKTRAYYLTVVQSITAIAYAA